VTLFDDVARVCTFVVLVVSSLLSQTFTFARIDVNFSLFNVYDVVDVFLLFASVVDIIIIIHIH